MYEINLPRDWNQLHRYDLDRVIAFGLPTDGWSGFSNVSPGFPISVILPQVLEVFQTTEALYQALSFPENPEIQRKIQLAQTAAAAKKIKNEHFEMRRPDWPECKFRVMAWCIQQKLNQYPELHELLAKTGHSDLVEMSPADQRWGVVLIDKKDQPRLEGRNWMGRLWMMQRDGVVPEIPASQIGLKLFGEWI